MKTNISGDCACAGMRYAVSGERQASRHHCLPLRAMPRHQRPFCGGHGLPAGALHAAARVSIAAGSLDASQGLHITAHIYTAEAGDYYAIEPGVEFSSGGMHSAALPE